MQVSRHNTAGEFLALTKARLDVAEAENNLILGISKYFAANPEAKHIKPYLFTVGEIDELVGAALMTPPRHLILSRMPESALAAIADYLMQEKIPVPGVVGPKEASRSFAEYWKNRTGKPTV